MVENKIAVIGGGGREACLAQAYAKSGQVDRILAFPGNDWIRDRITDKPVEVFPNIKTTNVSEIVQICQEKGVGLVDVCQDDAVAIGLVNWLRKGGVPVVGPTREAGQLEWDKSFARFIASKLGLPQPDYRTFCSVSDGLDYIGNHPNNPVWVKASGLASGKGAIYAANKKEEERAIKEMSNFGKAGDNYVIEEHLQGEEFSAFYLGPKGIYIASAQDYKREFNFDQGRNTGSMGSISPTSMFTEEIKAQVSDQVQKIMKEMEDRGRKYDGVLYYSGMVVKRGEELVPHIIEINSRWGDPEAQVIVPSILNDFFEIGMRSAENNLNDFEIKADDLTRVAVTVASRGYPGDYSDVIGREVFGIDEAMAIDGVSVYGAGLKIEDDRYRAAGGRLMSIVGTGVNTFDARERALAGASRISIEGNKVHYRTDIGWRNVDWVRLGRGN